MNHESSSPVIDIESSDAPPQQQALTVRDAVHALEKTPAPAQSPVTAAQAKVDAIANLTASAYARASELRLSQEESAALQAPFRDEDFQTGAAGKESLIYIQHAALRDRFNKVLGLGQWSVIPRSRWGEDYEYFNSKTRMNEKATRIYVEAMLLIRGCFVAESIGDMDYYHNNRSTNYGDAVEGATTQALRRCAKMFGVGLQAWDKAWCEGWWQRRNFRGNSQQPPPPPQQQQQQVPVRQTAPPAQQPRQAPVGGEADVFPVVTVESVKTVHSKPDAPKKWTAYFVKFSDGFSDLEAATFDTKLADFAMGLKDTGENAKLTTKPGRKPGSREIVALERAEQPPDNSPFEGTVPPDLDLIP
jgi:hypothetical protein